MTAKYYNYDIFISHNHADKEWVRELASKIANEDYYGRKLRPWLDEQILEPGNLKSNEELTTALDRSRVLGLVLSPDSVASYWVNFEIEHFLKTRENEAVVLLLLKDCLLPEKLAKSDVALIDFRAANKIEENLSLLWGQLKPKQNLDINVVQQNIDNAFDRFVKNDPGGFYAEPTKERDDFYNELSKYPINDAVFEGFTMVAWKRAAMYLNTIGSGFRYNYKMLLGECLGIAVLESRIYRRVVQQFLSLNVKSNNNTSLLFVVARAYSKLAETDIHQVDLSVIIRAISLLDIKTIITNEEKALEGMFVRIVGKLRNLPLGELLIKTLSEGGESSKIIAAGAISINYEKASPVFYLSKAEENFKNRVHTVEPQNEISSPKLLSLLFDLSVDQNRRVQNAVQMAKQEIQTAYPDVDFPYGYFWFNRAKDFQAKHVFNGPFIGSFAMATIENMNQLALQTNVNNVVCLTEDRIVESLFDQCSAVLVVEQDPGSLLCNRLRSNGMPFAMITTELMTQLNDGDQIMISEKQITRWKK